MTIMLTSRATVAGRSWESTKPGIFCFEATIDGQPTELHVSEDVAFDFLKAWTPSSAKCLEILRLHRQDLARMLEQKIRARRRRGPGGFYLLTWRDFHAATDGGGDAMAEVIPLSPLSRSESANYAI
jgi:hypothetical protein